MHITKQEKAFLLGLEKLTRETGVIPDGLFLLREAEYDELDSRAGYARITLGPKLFGFGWSTPAHLETWEENQKTLVKAQITKPLDNIRALDYMLKQGLSSYQCTPNDPFPGNHHYYSLLPYEGHMGYREARFIVVHNVSSEKNPNAGTEAPRNVSVLRIIHIPSTHPESPQP
jgi:hypothetical protein